MAARSRLLMYGLPALAAVALVAALASIVNSNTPAATVAPRSMPPTARAEGPSTATSSSLPSPTTTGSAVIGALGTVEPASREVSVATRFPGVVTEVRVIDGSKVTAGDVLFVIDSALPAVTVVQRQRDLSVAEARLAQTRQRAAVLAADVAVARGIAVSAEADLDEANDLVRIADRLQSGSSITEREMVRRRNLLRVAEGRVAEVKARLARAVAEFALVDPQNNGPTLRIEEAAVAQAKAALAFAEAELDQRTVRAPSDGTVLAVNIRPGEFATVGASTPPILMGLLDPLHVRVDIDEADVPRFASGANAVGLPRGAPERRIALRYVRAEPLVKAKRTLSGLSSDRVDTRVLQVVYAVDPPVDGLRPGQVIDVFIEVASGRPAVAPVRR